MRVVLRSTGFDMSIAKEVRYSCHGYDSGKNNMYASWTHAHLEQQSKSRPGSPEDRSNDMESY